MPVQNPDTFPEQADVAIIGAGMAGLYCAWRLLTHQPSLKVVIIERLDRTGGRLDSDVVRIENAAGTGQSLVKEEEGGMRFNYSMTELMHLLSALQLCDEVVPFPMSDPHNRYYIRGESFTVTESTANNNAIWSQLYNLAPAEQEKSPVEIITNVYHRILAENGVTTPPANPTPEFWQKFRLDFTWKGVALNRWQLWGLLCDMGFTQECVTMLSQTLGFAGPFISTVSAGEAFQILEDFPKNPTYYTLRRGFSTLPNALVKAVEEKGGQIFLSTNVDVVQPAGSDYTLTLTVAPPSQSASPSIRGGESRSINAHKVILAMASNALDALYVRSPALNGQPESPQLWKDLHGVVNMRLMKINLYYNEAWWANGLSGQPACLYGPSFTDLPLNAVYPFYSITGAPTNGPAALTIYCDYTSTDFWEGLQNVSPLFSSPLQKQHSQPPQVMFAASDAVVMEATQQLKELFNTHWVPRPVLTSYRLWGGESDFGYGYHQWAMNADDRQIMERLSEPIRNIYICNESYSDMQGWVNGSLRSADRVLGKFGIGLLGQDTSLQPCQEPPAT